LTSFLISLLISFLALGCTFGCAFASGARAEELPPACARAEELPPSCARACQGAAARVRPAEELPPASRCAKANLASKLFRLQPLFWFLVSPGK
jgi:hypothetical protein